MDDPMADNSNWGWQGAAKTMKARTTYLWKEQSIPPNVFFNVGPKGQKKLIGGHRDLLSISSEAFYAMFYGPITKSKDLHEPIDEEDIDPKAFRLMLKKFLRYQIP
ncbi:hypothetical protein RvY_07944-2 [Ramazzottius varieornatus]|uniref:BTB domain-containing protein n=1 Tax=Ramazzottius varieornatus TaxID=947166 RepID=A0A1D1V6J2_RAMVA|nr:hypothetical protein RvY_07944-2 [Ramazzottius varieornatus]